MFAHLTKAFISQILYIRHHIPMYVYDCHDFVPVVAGQPYDFMISVVPIIV